MVPSPERDYKIFQIFFYLIPNLLILFNNRKPKNTKYICFAIATIFPLFGIIFHLLKIYEIDIGGRYSAISIFITIFVNFLIIPIGLILPWFIWLIFRKLTSINV